MASFYESKVPASLVAAAMFNDSCATYARPSFNKPFAVSFSGFLFRWIRKFPMAGLPAADASELASLFQEVDMIVNAIRRHLQF